MQRVVQVLALLCCSTPYVLSVSSTTRSDRNVVATLKSPAIHTGNHGRWADADWCPPNSYAGSYRIKAQSFNPDEDNTGLNGIELICQGKQGGVKGDPIRSQVGPSGDWSDETAHCPYRKDMQLFLIRFRLWVEHENPDDMDESAVNNIRFACGRLDRKNKPVTSHLEGGGEGHLIVRSNTCPLGSAICGMMTKVQPDKQNGDDTGLNDVEFYCCDD